MPLAAVRLVSSSPTGPSSSCQAFCTSLNRNGRPIAAYSGTTLAIAPWLLAEMSSVPERRAVIIAASSPSCAECATWISMRPLVLAFTRSAKSTAASWRGLPGAAPWPSVSLVACACAPKAAATAARANSVWTNVLRCMSCLLVEWMAWRSVNQHAAVHVERDAGAVAGQVAGQVQACACHVVGHAEAAERDVFGDLGLALVA